MLLTFVVTHPSVISKMMPSSTCSENVPGRLLHTCNRLLALWYSVLFGFEHCSVILNYIKLYCLFPSCLMLFGHLVRMDESADARRILTAVSQNDWKRPAGRPHTSWLATMKDDLSSHNLSVENATKLKLDRPLWGLLAVSGAMH